MNVDDGKHKGESRVYEYSHMSTIMAATSTPIIVGLFLLALILYLWSTKASKKERTELFIELIKSDQLPKGLLDAMEIDRVKKKCVEMNWTFIDKDGMLSIEEKEKVKSNLTDAATTTVVSSNRPLGGEGQRCEWQRTTKSAS